MHGQNGSEQSGEVVGHSMCFGYPSDGRGETDDGRKHDRADGPGAISSSKSSQDIKYWSEATGHDV